MFACRKTTRFFVKLNRGNENITVLFKNLLNKYYFKPSTLDNVNNTRNNNDIYVNTENIIAPDHAKYFNKYLKYKNKYLLLKNKIN